jgi:hypothetical protein
MGYYKHLIGSARAIISELRLDEGYERAVLGMIARTIDGKVIHRDEFLGRLSSLRGEIESRAQRESRSDLCYWLKRRLFPQKKVCAQCKAETDALIEGLCSKCYWRGTVEIPCEPADESAVSADGSVLKHAPKARFSGLSPAETDASASGS